MLERDADRRRALVRAPLLVRADRDRGRRRATRTRCAAAHVEPDSEERRRQIVGGARRRSAAGRDPHGVLAEVVYLVESPRRPRLQLRRALPPAAEPRRRDDDPAPHPRTSRSEATASRSSRTAATRTRVRAGVENVVGGPARGRVVHVRARRQGRDRRARGAARRDHVLPRRGLVRGQDRARLAKLVEALGGGEAALEAARLAKADQASELVREFPELEGHVGARVRAARGLSGSGLRARSTSSTCPTRPAAPLPPTEAGRVLSAADKIDTLNVSFWPRRSGRPAHATRTGCGAPRSASAGSRPRATSRSRAS